MRAYLDNSGVYHRTKTGLKAPFEPVEVPTDHAGLIDFINRVVPRPTDLPEPAAQPYQNGHPTTLFMKSRDPAAIFTCKTCGTNNAH
jgi:hypothetical protein